MKRKDLRDIIAQVLSEMNVTDTTSATSAAPAQKADTASAATEDGFVEDVAEVDIKKTVSGRASGLQEMRIMN